MERRGRLYKFLEQNWKNIFLRQDDWFWRIYRQNCLCCEWNTRHGALSQCKSQLQRKKTEEIT